MANHKSAKKRARQDIKRRERNQAYISKVKTAVKTFRVSLDDLDAGKLERSKVEANFSAAQALLHKAAGKGLLHRNNAARHISRLALQLNKRPA